MAPSGEHGYRAGEAVREIVAVGGLPDLVYVAELSLWVPGGNSDGPCRGRGSSASRLSLRPPGREVSHAISSGSPSWSSSLPNTRPSNLDAAAASMPGRTCW